MAPHEEDCNVERQKGGRSDLLSPDLIWHCWGITETYFLEETLPAVYKWTSSHIQAMYCPPTFGEERQLSRECGELEK